MKTAMDDRPVGATCETALDGEVLAAYVAGRLGEQETEAFEQHFFGCEECWALVGAATGLRASLAASTEDAARATPLAIALGRSRRRWVVLAPAAGLAAVLAGLALFGPWSADAPIGPGGTPGEVFRGAGQTLSLDVVVDGGSLRASWAPLAMAAAYEVRLYDAEGRLLRASDVDGRTTEVDIEVLDLGGVPGVAALDVVALDGFGQVLLRSERVSPRP